MKEKEPIQRSNQKATDETTVSENFAFLVNSLVSLRTATTHPDKKRAQKAFRASASEILTQRQEVQFNISEAYLKLAKDNMYAAQVLYHGLLQLNILRAPDLQSLLGLKSSSERESVPNMIRRALEK